jgi:hypothetical protein
VDIDVAVVSRRGQVSPRLAKSSPRREVKSMKLLTKKLIRKLPPLYATDNDPDPMVICKFFCPDSDWTWYAIEYDGKDLFFGWVDGDFPELGYFSLSELKSTRGKWGLPVERDRWFTPCRLSKLRAELGR